MVLIPDNDEQGREHVRIVAHCLLPVAARVRVLDIAQLWPDAEHSDDISDWFARGGGSAEALWSIVEALPPFTPNPQPPRGQIADERNRTFNAMELMPAPPRPRRMPGWSTMPTGFCSERARAGFTDHSADLALARHHRRQAHRHRHHAR